MSLTFCTIESQSWLTELISTTATAPVAEALPTPAAELAANWVDEDDVIFTVRPAPR